MPDKTRIFILGGYGNFGRHIAARLARESDIAVIIAGRDAAKARTYADQIGAEWAAFDVHKDLPAQLTALQPAIVIHTSGPFQGQGYDAAAACIAKGCHYIDLADGRDFVAGIGALDQQAQEAGILAVSGASSVPGLTSAILDHYAAAFTTMDAVDYGIATAQRTNAGLATTAAILGYAGKAFTTLQDGRSKTIFGWQDVTARRYPELGTRLLANCDIPDLALFPQRYPQLKTIRFHAGLEVPLMHLTLWAMTWLVRAGILKSLAPLAGLLNRIAPVFDIFGSDRSGFHMEMTGTGRDGKPQRITFYILTSSGHGPYIPCIPSILLALGLARGEIVQRGAMPCIGLLPLEAYLTMLGEYDISWQEARS